MVIQNTNSTRNTYKSFDKPVFELITRGSAQSYSPNNIKTITIAPNKVSCTYFLNDRNNGDKKLENYTIESVKDEYKSVFSSFSESGDGQHTCQNVEEITLVLRTDKTMLTTQGPTNALLSPKDIFILDMLKGSGKVSNSQIENAQKSIKEQINQQISAIKQNGITKSTDILNAFGFSNLTKYTTQLISSSLFIDALKTGLPRLRKITIQNIDKEAVIWEREDDEWYKAIGLYPNKYPNFDGKDKPLSNYFYRIREEHLKDAQNEDKTKALEKDKEDRKSKFKNLQTQLTNTEKLLTNIVIICKQELGLQIAIPSTTVYNCDNLIKFDKHIPKVEESITSAKEAYINSIQAYAKTICAILNKEFSELLSQPILCKSLEKKYSKDYFVVNNNEYKFSAINICKVCESNVNRYSEFIVNCATLYSLYVNDKEVSLTKYEKIEKEV